jgi:hypothetical protein
MQRDLPVWIRQAGHTRQLEKQRLGVTLGWRGAGCSTSQRRGQRLGTAPATSSEFADVALKVGHSRPLPPKCTFNSSLDRVGIHDRADVGQCPGHRRGGKPIDQREMAGPEITHSVNAGTAKV